MMSKYYDKLLESAFLAEELFDYYELEEYANEKNTEDE